jgi:hypothetical protein
VAHNIAVSKRAWLVFAAIQTIGCILAGYGTVYSESAFVRGSWLLGLFLLLPGNLPAAAVGQKLIHIRTAYIFFPIAVVCNAILWAMWSGIWRMVRNGKPTRTPQRYKITIVVTAIVFVIVNTIHFLRPVTCFDCFFPYGLPFTFYRDGGFAGGGGLVLRGLAADAATVITMAMLLGILWERLAKRT